MVYDRGKHDGINGEVLSIALDLQRITKKFAEHAKPEFKPLTEHALGDALKDADYAAGKHKIANPFRDEKSLSVCD
jgi:hypothetical protein